VLRFVIREAGAETAVGSPVPPDETQEAGIVQVEASRPLPGMGDSSSELAVQETAEDPIQADGADLDTAQDPPPQSDTAGISQARWRRPKTNRARPTRKNRGGRR